MCQTIPNKALANPKHVNYLPRELLGIVKALGLQTENEAKEAKNGISNAGQPE